MKSLGLAGTNPCFGVCPLKIPRNAGSKLLYQSNFIFICTLKAKEKRELSFRFFLAFGIFESEVNAFIDQWVAA